MTLGTGSRRLWIMGLVVMAAMMPLAGCARHDETRAEQPPPQVRVARVGSDSSAAIVKAVGTVQLRRESNLGFTSAGRIASLTVNEGDRVTAGQLLAALDPATVAADSATARAELQRARLELQRSETLFAKGWVTRPRVDNARAAFEAAQARVSAAGFQQSNARIVAPGDGVILARLAEPGQVVAAGMPVLSLGEARGGYVLRVPLTDRETAGLTAGAAATVRIEALGGAPVIGQVIEIAGRADPATGTFLVEIGLPAEPRLKSGQIGSVEIVAAGPVEGAPRATGLMVPPAAIFAARAGEAFVYVLPPGSDRIKLRRIMVSDVNDGGITVLGGLAAGESVAVSGVDRLSDGQRVRPVKVPR